MRREAWGGGTLVAAMLFGAACSETAPTPGASNEPPVAAAGTPALDEVVEWGTRIDLEWLSGCGTGEDLWKARDSSTIFCEDDGVRLEADGDHGARFALATLPAWEGHVRRLRLSWRGEIDEATRLRGLRALKRAATREQLEAALARAWEVEAAGERRTARPLLPGMPLELRPAAPVPASELDVDCALQEGARTPVIFRLRALATAALPAEAHATPGGGWVALEPAVESGVADRFSLEVHAEAPVDPTRGWPVCSIRGEGGERVAVTAVAVDWEARARRGLESRAEAPARSSDSVR